MISAITLNAVGAVIIVGGWAYAVAHAHRALAAAERRPAPGLAGARAPEPGRLARISPAWPPSGSGARRAA